MKKNLKKKLLNISVNENNNIINNNPNNFLKNVKPLFINTKAKDMKIKSTYNKGKIVCQINDNDSRKSNKIRKSGKNIIENSYTMRQMTNEINEVNEANNSNNQIYNNYYSINNIVSSNLPFKVINVFN